MLCYVYIVCNIYTTSKIQTNGYLAKNYNRLYLYRSATPHANRRVYEYTTHNRLLNFHTPAINAPAAQAASSNCWKSAPSAAAVAKEEEREVPETYLLLALSCSIWKVNE